MPPNEEAARQFLLSKATPEELGGFGEAVWGNLLRRAGYACIWLSAIEQGGAPMALSDGYGTVVPDFDVKSGGRSVYVDAKTKKRSICYRKAREERHGINENCFRSYRRISQMAGSECCIAIVELQRENESGRVVWSGSLLFETMTNLSKPVSEHPESPPKVYWPRKRFCDLDGGLTALELYAIACGESRRTYRPEIEAILRL